MLHDIMYADDSVLITEAIVKTHTQNYSWTIVPESKGQKVNCENEGNGE